MWETLYDMADFCFGTGLVKGLKNWMDDMFTAMNKILNNGYVDSVYNIFAAVACSLLIIYFFEDLMNQASRDMFSFEKLVIAFIRLLIAFSVLLYLPDILKQLTTLAKGFTDMVSGSDGIASAMANTGTLHKGNADIKKAYEDEFDHLTKILSILGAMIKLLIPWLISFFADLMGKFIITSTAIMLIVRATFSPLAVVQLFEEGSRSSGMRYLKGLFAEALSFAVILVIIAAANGITANLPGGFDWTDAAHLNENLTFSTMIPIMIPKLVIAGGMASGSKIAHEVFGA